MDPERPTFTGLLVFRDLTHRFSLLYPEGWVCDSVPADAGGGGVCYPDPADGDTYLLMQGRRLRVRVRPDDLGALHEGFLDGLRSLPAAQIERADARVVGELLDLEARLLYQDGNATRQRWTRLLYQGRAQVSLTAQGATAAAFAYWEPMFNTAMHTIRFGDWWADATGRSWQRTLGQPAKGGERP